MTASLRRIQAMIIRHWYLIVGSVPRLIELCYWPFMQMILWGFIQTFLIEQSSFFAQAGGLVLGGMMLWDVLFRGQIGLSVSFFEEIYSRNLGHLLATPLRMGEYVVSLMVASFLRTMVGWIPATVCAIWFFGFSIYQLGLGLGFFFLGLIAFGWSIGLAVSGLVMRFGLGAEGTAWSLVFALAPLSGVYYPLSILPQWMQALAHAIPSSYIFEGMRAIVLEHRLRWDYLASAFALDAVWLAAGIWAFFAFYRTARERGMLLQVGE